MTPLQIMEMACRFGGRHLVVPPGRDSRSQNRSFRPDGNPEAFEREMRHFIAVMESGNQ